MKYRLIRREINRLIKDVKADIKREPLRIIHHMVLDAAQECKKSLILKIKRKRKEGRSRKKARKIVARLKGLTSNVSKAGTALTKFSETYQEALDSWEAALNAGVFTKVSNPDTTKLTAPIFIEGKKPL